MKHFRPVRYLKREYIGWSALFETRRVRRRCRNKYRKQHGMSNVEKIDTVIKGIGALAIFAAIFCLLIGPAGAETTDRYVLCHPDSCINIRSNGHKTSERIGYLCCGDVAHLDGNSKNGFAHIVDMGIDYDEGWVIDDYFVSDEPVVRTFKTTIVSDGRVAARSAVNGERRKWLKNGTEITVYAYASEWCVTNQGYVMTKYISIEGGI